MMIWIKRTAGILCAAALLLSGCAAGQPSVPAAENLQTRPSVTQPASQYPQVAVLTLERMQEIESAWSAAMNAKLGDWYTEAGTKVTDGVRYYGSYHGYDVLFVPADSKEQRSISIGTVTFTEPMMFELYAYRDGQFRQLKDLFQGGEISDEDLSAILAAHLSMQRKIYPLFAQPESMAELYDQMKEAFLTQYVAEGQGTKEQLSIIYYGEYNGAHVGFINGVFLYTQAMTSEKVGKLTFHYKTGQKLMLYYNGELMYLSQAYERGILTDESVAELHRNFEKPSNVEKE